MVRWPDEADRAHPGTGPADVAYGLARPGPDATPLTQLDPD
ncbi:MAG TPA: carbohydrate kinase, partial [Streptomyces sp.]|nr:carbohydrate kinase [Streptomyces sp.]